MKTKEVPQNETNQINDLLKLSIAIGNLNLETEHKKQILENLEANFLNNIKEDYNMITKIHGEKNKLVLDIDTNTYLSNDELKNISNMLGLFNYDIDFYKRKLIFY